MSCEGNRHHFILHLIHRTDLAQKLGVSPSVAAQFLERLYQSARAGSKLQANTPDANVESALTAQFFERMRAVGLKPPTHSPSGLPKLPSRAGYGQLERVLQAVEQGKALPKLAEALLQQMQSNQSPSERVIRGVGFDVHGYYRCVNCGRFASQRTEHICPKTANSETLRQHLTRRLGLPASAFAGYHTDPLEQLLEETRQQGTLSMVHALSGEKVEVTLDGLPLALQNGYVPERWQNQAVFVSVTDPEGVVRIIPVVNAEGLNRVTPADSLVQQLAQFYGLQIPPDAPIQQVHKLLQQGLRRHPGSSAHTQLEGGQAYDLGHFLGTEYRKGNARGQMVTIRGKSYGVYARSMRPEDKSSARGRLATDVDNVVIGRTLPAAIGLLAEGSVLRTSQGIVEVYDASGNLISAYDPKTYRAGDVQGNPNASPEQMAAVLAWHMMDPQSAFDYALIQDFISFRDGNGSPIAAADSGYLALRHFLENESGVLHLGAKMGTRRCPRCGRFIGINGHDCPMDTRRKAESQPKVASAPVNETPVADETQPVTVVTHPEPPAPAQIAPQQVAVQVVLPENFAQTLGAAVAEVLASRLSPQPAQEMSALHGMLAQFNELLKAQQGVLEKISTTTSATMAMAPLDSHALGKALGETLAAQLPSVSPVPFAMSEVGATANARRKCPKCGQFMGENHTCPPRQERQGIQRPNVPLTEVEKILEGIQLPAPDLYMDNVPEEWGGKKSVQIPENLPEFLTEYEMSDEARSVFKIIAMQLRKKSKKPTNRAFGLYGPAGTGKNTIARQLAACLRTDDGKQGIPYYEINVTPEMDIQQAIGEVVLTTDENGNTVSQVRLGPLGIVAATGGVVAVNEIVRSPKLATALQSIIEDGEISVPTPEGGTVKIPVHPSAIFVTTWNPGYEGDADRPAKAFLSRILALPLPYPNKEAQIRRLKAYFSNQGLDIPRDEILEAAVNYFAELRVLTGDTGQTPQIGTLSPTSTAPGPRELARFVEIGTQMDWNEALKTLEIICDQDPEAHAEQVSILRERFEAHFGALLN